MKMAPRSLPRRWRKSASDLASLGGLPEMQSRERHLADWIKGECVTVPRDNVAQRGHSHLTRRTVSDKVA